MLSKRNRASKKAVDLIFKQGRFINSPNLTFKYILENDFSEKKISFIVPKSVAKSAVKRNSLRRRGYNVLKKHLISFPSGILGVFVFKKYQEDTAILENEVIFVRNKLVK